jgi:uncharacterized protein (DUF58 family)
MATLRDAPTPRPLGPSVSLRDLLDLQWQAAHLQIPPQRRVATHLAGGYLSSLRGRGIEFDEVRGYQPGDDIRTIDWRVTARTGKPHTKIFRAERERPVYLVLDVGASMYFGTRVTFKICVAAQAAALIAWASVANRDRVGGLLFAPDQHWEFKPAASRRAIARMLNTVAELTTQRPANFAANPLSAAAQRLRHVAKPGSTIYLISDFSGLDNDAERHLAQLSQHNELYALHVYDPLEQHAPPAGCYNITDGKQQKILDTTTAQSQQRYRERFQQRMQTLDALARRAKIMQLNLATNEAVTSCLLSQLGKRR